MEEITPKEIEELYIKGEKMTIMMAKKELDNLRKQISAIREEYDFGGWAKYCGRQKRKPLEKRADELMLAIIKAEEETEIGL